MYCNDEKGDRPRKRVVSMTPEELRAIIAYLRQRVHLDTNREKDMTAVSFAAPTEEEMIGAGLNVEGTRRLLQVPWWDEMVTDIVETPDFCEPEDSPQQVLEYARDVVSDYIRKRFTLN
jgi:hypothetical protein